MTHTLKSKGIVAIVLSLSMVLLSAFSAMADDDPIASLIAARAAEDGGIEAMEAEDGIVALGATVSNAIHITNTTASTGMVNGLEYNSSTKTVTLDGYVYNGAIPAIIVDANAGDITIELVGDNSITVNSETNSGIYVAGNTKLTITGSGTLNIQTSKQAAIFCNGTLDIDATTISAAQSNGSAPIISKGEMKLIGSSVSAPAGGVVKQAKLIDGSGATFTGWTILAKNSGTTNEVSIVPTSTVPPTISPANGSAFSGTNNLTITSAVAGADIYYTTDGSTPTLSSTKYDSTAKPTVTLTSAITTVTVKAISVSGGVVSEVATATYTYRKSSSNSSGGGSTGGGGGGGSSLPKTATAGSGTGSGLVLGSWERDANGWWFKKAADGSWPANTWFNMSLRGTRWYFFNAAGYMQTGWLISNGKTYYLEPNAGDDEGLMVTGWKQIRGNWYYFNAPNGDMAVSTTTPDGYQVGADGIWR